MMSRCHQSVLLCIVCDRVLAEGVPPLRNQKCRAWARVLGGRLEVGVGGSYSPHSFALHIEAVL